METTFYSVTIDDAHYGWYDDIDYALGVMRAFIELAPAGMRVELRVWKHEGRDRDVWLGGTGVVIAAGDGRGAAEP